MTKQAKLIAVGNSTGIILPKEVLQLLRASRGDSVFITEGSDGSVRLTAFDPDFAQQMDLAETIMREDRDVLRVLAK